jgi:exosortase A
VNEISGTRGGAAPLVSATGAVREQDWRFRATVLTLALAGVTALFWGTFASMVQTWWRSETFAHGFIVFPTVGYLIWRKRHQIRAVQPHTDWRALAVVLPLGVGWSLAHVTDVLIVQQLCVVLLLPTFGWLLLGSAVIRVIAFPLAFLLFAVPAGEALIPHMMNFTAAFTVHALRFTGIPVYWDGTFFSIPSGSWSVVEGCSGVRYLIASIFLGTLYAYLTYRSIWRRALLIGLAVVFPVIANGLRAYMIVMIADLSDMRLALGIDHIIYGWIFFGIVIVFMFWIGSFWWEKDVPPDGNTRDIVEQSRPTAHSPQGRCGVLAALVVGVLALAVWPVWAVYLDGAQNTAPVHLSVPPGAGGWSTTKSFTTWKPRYVRPTVEVRQQYKLGADRVGLFIEYYRGQRQGAELVNTQNVMIVQKHPVWRMPAQYEVPASLNGGKYQVLESRMESDGQNLLIWHWNWITGEYMINPYEAKFKEAISRLVGGSRDAAGIVVYTPLGDRIGPARARLQKFVDDMLPSIQHELDQARGG